MVDQRRIDEAYGVRHIDEAYVDELSRPLVRFMSEPPHDSLTVLAIALRGALYEALEQLSMAQYNLDHEEAGRPLHRTMYDHGQIYVARQVIRRVADALQLFHPGPNNTPGERLLAARSRAYLTQPQLAEAVGVDRGHISHIERGRRTLTRGLAVLMAGPLGVTPEYLLTGRGTDGQADSEA